MVIVAHLSLQESFLLPGSTLNATLNLLNVSEEIVSEKGPYHSNLLTLFEDYKEHQQLNLANEFGDDSSSSSSSLYYTSPSTPVERKPSSLFAFDEALEWKIDVIYAQVYGVCIADSTWLNPITSEKDASYNDDHLYQYECYLKNLVTKKKNSQVIFMSHPREFDHCSGQNLRLYENKKMDFSLCLPPCEIPPSYKGTMLRYIYFVAISMQVSNKKKGVFTKVMTVPFKIRNPIASLSSVNSCYKEKIDFRWKFHDRYSDRRNRSLSSLSSSFKRSKDSDSSVNATSYYSSESASSFFYSFRAIDNVITANSKTNFYEITDEDKKVCRFSLSNTAFCIGDTLLGVFDFSFCNVTCLKVNIELIHEESFANWLLKDFFQPESNEKPQEVDGYYRSLGSKISRSTVGYFSRHTLNTITTDFHMMIPPHCPAQFSTDLVNIRWYLKFTFYLLKQPTSQSELIFTSQKLLEQKDYAQVEVLEWQLPIQVFVPTHFRPLHTQSHSREMCMLCYHD